MITISEELRFQIEEYLIGIPDIDNEDLRKQIARDARFSKRIINKIKWKIQPSANFVSYFIDFLLEWGDIDDDDDRISIIEYLKATYRMVGGDAQQALSVLLRSLDIEISDRKKKADSEFKFINREQDIADLTDEISVSPRHAVHAPAGFGKTWLLGRLKHVFNNKGWLAASFTMDQDTTIEDLAAGLLKSIDNEAEISFNNKNTEDMADEFSGILKRFWEEHQPGKGIVLLIDTNTIPTNVKVFNYLINTWLPGVITNFQGLTFFATELSRFRIILAGRFFDNSIVMQLQALDGSYSIYQLTPFSDSVIAKSVSTYLPDIQSDWRVELWSNLFFYSGGHPGILNTLLKYYSDQNKPLPRKFFDKNTQLIEKVVLEELNAILNDIPADAKNLLISLSPFRYLSYEVIEEIVSDYNEMLYGQNDVNLIVDNLTQRYLLTWDEQTGHLLKDAISRRIMTLYLRLTNKQNDLDYSRRCSIAKSIYLNRLSDLSGNNVPSTRWAIEVLFQSLHESSHLIGKVSNRQDLRKRFWGESDDGNVPPSLNSILHECLEKLVDGREKRMQIAALQRVASADWEFIFTLNYFLRDEVFNQNWLGVLLAKTQSYLNNSG